MHLPTSLGLALICFTAGCGMPFWNPPPPPPEPATPPPASSADIEAIYLTRSACLGPCPHYHLLLRSDGTATYVGVTDTTQVGTYDSQLDSMTFRALASAIVRNGFFDHPDLPISFDAPVTSITVFVRDPVLRHKAVVGCMPDYHYLWPLAATLDSLGATLPWQFRSSDTLPPGSPGGAV